MRLKIFKIIIHIAFLIILGGLFYLQIIKGDYYLKLSQKNYIRIIPEEGRRGDIFDRNGLPLAISRDSFDVLIIPQEIEDLDKVIKKLSKYLNKKESILRQRYKRNYISPFIPVVVASDIGRRKAMLLEEQLIFLKGVTIRDTPLRYYPYSDLTSHIIGYLDRKPLSYPINKFYGYSPKVLVGESGIEKTLDDILQSKNGGIQIEVDNRGRKIKILGYKAPEDGNDISLSIDVRLQEIASEVLKDNKGCILIMEPFSGKILALVSHPDYNPNLFLPLDSYKNKLYRKRLLKRKDAPLLNRVIQGLYPAGSLFKLITSYAGLNEGIISTDNTFECEGALKIGKNVFRCWSRHGKQNLEKAIVHSCNIYFYKLGSLLGGEKLSEYAFLFGLGNTTGIQLPYEKKGFVPNPQKRKSSGGFWYKGDTLNLAIGQGELLVTVLQIARLMTIFANGGILLRPTLLKKDPPFKERVFKKKYIKIIREGLLKTVKDPEGTAHILFSPNIEIAGKTSTAQVGRGSSHAWFAGFLPFHTPKYVIVVFLEYGGSSIKACLLARELILKLKEKNLL